MSGVSSDLLAALGRAARRLLFLPPQGSTSAVAIDRLHVLEISVMTTLALAIAIATVAFVWRFHRSRRPGRTPRIVAPRWLEIVVYGGILSFFLAIWWIGVRQYLRFGEAPAGALEVYVTAKQWMWKFGYPDGLTSAGVLYVPAGRPVKLLLTSRDVIHSFYVPDFRIKRDALPGRYTGIWFEALGPGRHDVLCAEMCGTGHSRMRAEVRVLTPRDFEAWRTGGAASRDASRATMVERGRATAIRHGCLQCHTLDGTPATGPTWQGLFGRPVELADGRTLRADEAYLTRSMMDPAAEVVHGFAPIMPSYRGQLAPSETAALVELIKSLRERSNLGGERP
ncbi:MAG TPA: cytochrome c oxidase subunit II [Myxococcota bacterium]|jgi:cytochrome c oxidase subunit 2|nr:cytochrome c oxidase subunit II [Myxococcota bacterium]